MWDHERVRVIDMFADGPVKFVKLLLIGQPEPKDHRAHASHQVRPDCAARVAGPVEAARASAPMSSRPASRYSSG